MERGRRGLRFTLDMSRTFDGVAFRHMFSSTYVNPARDTRTLAGGCGMISEIVYYLVINSVQALSHVS